MLVAPLEQRRSIYEWLGLEIQLEGNLALRFFGIFVLHKVVRIILRSGLLLAIEGPHELPIVHRCNEENLE